VAVVTCFSYHISQEQWSPADLLTFVCDAERAGFDSAFSSDHLQPWSPRQGHSASTWSWMGAALQATHKLKFSAITVPCGWRYHPIQLAQAIATLCVMYPGRLPWVALGSGEALNEQPFVEVWPEKSERNARLLEGAGILRRLLSGERVVHEGLIPVADARIWDLPEVSPAFVGAALSCETAEWLGGWADGLYTVAANAGNLREIINAFYRGGGRGKPVHVKVDVCWAPDDDLALAQAYDAWRCNAVGGDAAGEWRQPEEFEQAAKNVPPHKLQDIVLVSSDLKRHIAHLRTFIELGVDTIDVHAVAGDQRQLVALYGDEVLPALRSGAG
jgi:probable non-F420 flavinoid oxidoreductase